MSLSVQGVLFKTQDIAVLHQQIQAWRAQLEIMRSEKYSHFVGVQATNLYDDFQRKGEAVLEGHLKNSPFFDIWENLNSRVKKVNADGASRDPAVDASFSLTVIPHEEQFFGIVFTETSSWYDLFLKQGFCEDHSYWDNTDEPEGMSEEQWDLRAKHWTDMLARFGWVPAKAGFTYEFSEPYVTSLLEIEPHIPSIAERAKRIAKNELFNRFAAGMTKDDDTAPLTHAFFVGEAFVDFLRTDEGKKQLNDSALTLALQLKPLTRAILEEKWQLNGA